MHMHLFLWCFFMVKNCQKWVYMGMGEIFLEIYKSCAKEQQNTLPGNIEEKKKIDRRKTLKS